MCGKKLRIGRRAIIVSLLFLVLALQPLLAWPFNFGKQSTPTSSPTQTVQVQNTEDGSKEVIQSLKLRVKQLEDQLNESNTMLDNLSRNLEKSGTKLNNTQATAESLLNEIESLKNFLQASETSRFNLENEYDQLVADYDLKVDEANKLFQQASIATAKYNALASQKEKSPWSTTVGAAAVMQGGEYGVDATIGVGYGPVTLFGGATYMLDNDFSFRLDDLAFKAGLTYTF